MYERRSYLSPSTAIERTAEQALEIDNAIWPASHKRFGVTAVD